MPSKRKEPTDRRRDPSDFVRRAAGQGESRMAVPHASLKRRAVGLMKQSMRTDLFRPAVQPYDVEDVFVPRNWNFVEGGDNVPARPAPPRAAEKPAPKKAPPPEEIDDDDPEAIIKALEEADLDDDLDMPVSRPLEADEELDLPDLDEYDGSDLFDEADPDQAAEPAIPQSERTELPSALRNRRNYYENSDQSRKGGLLGGIIPGGGRPAPKTSSRRR